jgi:YHS domain-containing protein
MSGLLSLLLFAAFFYLMMRFGCGAHMVHGHEDHAGREGERGQKPGRLATAMDPVCGMEVRAGEGYAKMHQGREYRFCSRECLDRFESEPLRYAA